MEDPNHNYHRKRSQKFHARCQLLSHTQPSDGVSVLMPPSPLTRSLCFSCTRVKKRSDKAEFVWSSPNTYPFHTLLANCSGKNFCFQTDTLKAKILPTPPIHACLSLLCQGFCSLFYRSTSVFTCDLDFCGFPLVAAFQIWTVPHGVESTEQFWK